MKRDETFFEPPVSASFESEERVDERPKGFTSSLETVSAGAEGEGNPLRGFPSSPCNLFATDYGFGTPPMGGAA